MRGRHKKLFKNLQMNYRKLEQELDECKKAFEKQKKELEDQKKELEEQFFLDEAKKAAEAAHEELLLLIHSLITMRDNLLLKRDWIRENNLDDANINKLVENQFREIGKIMQKSGVEVLEDSGRFDISRQTVVDTRPTQDPNLVDHIAEIYRPGYLYKGEVLRGQEIILYTKDEKSV